MKTIDYIQNWLSENLSEKRYNHSLGCAKCAQKLAKIYHLDEDKAFLAGLIHDCAKNIEAEESLKIIKHYLSNKKIDKDFISWLEHSKNIYKNEE